MKAALAIPLLALAALPQPASAGPLSAHLVWGGAVTELFPGEFTRRDGQLPGTLDFDFGKPGYLEAGLSDQIARWCSLSLSAAGANLHMTGNWSVPTDSTGLHYRDVSWPLGHAKFGCVTFEGFYHVSNEEPDQTDRPWRLGAWFGPGVAYGWLSDVHGPTAAEDSVGIASVSSKSQFTVSLGGGGSARIARTRLSVMAQLRILLHGPTVEYETVASSDYAHGEGSFDASMTGLGISYRVH